MISLHMVPRCRLRSRLGKRPPGAWWSSYRTRTYALRFGQDWSETEGAERSFYLNKVKPHLDAGMNELNGVGVVQGCYFNRYMQLRGDQGLVEKTYSLSAWHSLNDLERWVRADTHLAIWGAGIKHYKQAGDDAKLRLYHEMAVLKAADQSFAYFNCHRRTGMLNALAFG